MSKKVLRMLCCCLCVALAFGAKSFPQGGQAGGDRDRPGSRGNPGGLNGPRPEEPAKPGGAKEPHHVDSTHARTAAQPHNGLQFGPVGRWWDDKNVIQTIGLRRDQQRRMDSIFDANKPAILESYQAFLKAQAHLSAVNKDPQADKATVFAAIDAVNQARSSLQKATSAMLLQIRKEMDPTQIERLQSMQ
jgi:Spy/CpxP family protein refolding chaperone